ncbi:glycosyltransferase [Candidatus Uhrbacteria bacterium]|nr:glycosyltransferase [Candidatus Uhrbacteria bacterium]
MRTIHQRLDETTVARLWSILPRTPNTAPIRTDLGGGTMKHSLRDRPTPEHTPPTIPMELKSPAPQPPSKATPPPHTELNVTAIIINYRTPHLIKSAVNTLRKAYPKLALIVTDNGSGDASTEYIKRLNCRTILNAQNLGHGRAIHQAMQSVTTKYAFLMDSDCKVRRGGFLEAMLKEIPGYYAIGWKRWVDRITGVPREWHAASPPSDKFVAYVHPAASLYNADIYHELPPAFHHGAPMLQNMVGAAAQEHKVKSFPIFDYIDHLVAGTRRMYNGHWEGKGQPNTWKKEASYPI